MMTREGKMWRDEAMQANEKIEQLHGMVRRLEHENKRLHQDRAHLADLTADYYGAHYSEHQFIDRDARKIQYTFCIDGLDEMKMKGDPDGLDAAIEMLAANFTSQVRTAITNWK